MESFRVRIDATNVTQNGRTKLWLFIDKSKTQVIHHIEQKICSLLNICADIRIKIDGYYLLSDDCIEVIKPDDVLVLEVIDSKQHEEVPSQKKKKKKKERKSVCKESINENENVAESRKRKAKTRLSDGESSVKSEEHLPNEVPKTSLTNSTLGNPIHNLDKDKEHENAHFDISTPSSIKKKRKRRRRKDKGKCFKNFEATPIPDENSCNTSGMNDSSHHGRMDMIREIKKNFQNPTHEPIDYYSNKQLEAKDEDKSKKNVSSNESTEQFVGNILKNIDTYPTIEGLPRLKDHIAFKVLELTNDYTPELSGYKTGTIIKSSNGNITLKLDTPYVKMNHGKFELSLDEDETETEYVTELEVPWSSVSDARLLP